MTSSDRSKRTEIQSLVPISQLTAEQRNTLRMLLPGYQAEETLIVPRGTLPLELKAEVISSDRVKLLVAGQRGMGKTTELERLRRLLEESEVLPVFIQFGAQHSITLPMLIRVMGGELLKHPTSKLTTKDRAKFVDWFSTEEEIYVEHEGGSGAAAIGGKIPLLTAELGVEHRKSTEKKKTSIEDRPISDLIARFNDLISSVKRRNGIRPVFIDTVSIVL